MDPQEILRLYDLEMRQDPPAGRAQVHRRPGLTLLTTPPPSPFAGWVLYTHLDKSEVDASIEAVIDFFRTRGGEFEWKVYDHDTPSDIRDRLHAHGFVSEELESLLVLDLETAPPEFFQPPSIDVQRVFDRRQLADIGRVQAEVWGEPFDDLEEMLETELRESPDSLSVYAVYVDGHPASNAWIRYYPERSFAELYGGSTVERFRSRGIYRALVAARVQEARRRGVRFLAVDTSAMSRPILEKLGFVFLTHTQPFVWHPPEDIPTE